MKTEIIQKMEKEGNYDGIDYNNGKDGNDDDNDENDDDNDSNADGSDDDNKNGDNDDGNYYNDGNINVTIMMTTKSCYC